MVGDGGWLEVGIPDDDSLFLLNLVYAGPFEFGHVQGLMDPYQSMGTQQQLVRHR